MLVYEFHNVMVGECCFSLPDEIRYATCLHVISICYLYGLIEV